MKFPPAEEYKTPCDSAGCRLNAMIRQRTESGHLNLCEPCYVKFHTRQSSIKCAQMGLDTPEQADAHFKANGLNLRRFGQSSDVSVSLVPGDVGALGDSS